MTCRLLQNLLYWQIHPHWYVTRYLYDTIVWYRNDLVKLQKEHAPQWYVSTPKNRPFAQKLCGIVMTRGIQVPRPGWRFLRAWTFWRRVLLTRRSRVARRFCTLHHRSTWRAVQRRARGEKRRGGEGGLGELGGEGRCKLIFFQVSVTGCFLVFLHSASKPGKAGYACCGRHFGSEHCWQLHIGFIARYTKACEKVM